MSTNQAIQYIKDGDNDSDQQDQGLQWESDIKLHSDVPALLPAEPSNVQYRIRQVAPLHLHDSQRSMVYQKHV